MILLDIIPFVNPVRLSYLKLILVGLNSTRSRTLTNVLDVGNDGVHEVIPGMGLEL